MEKRLAAKRGLVTHANDDMDGAETLASDSAARLGHAEG